MAVVIPFPRVAPMTEWQGFYSTSQISRLSGVPKRTLYDWKARGVIAPSVHLIEAGLVVDDGYSYADLAIIKLMRALRNRQLNLGSVAKALRHLYDRLGPPTSQGWQNAHVYIIDKEVFAQKPDEWDSTVATRGGQKAMSRVIGDLFEEEAAILIPEDYAAYVEIDLNVMSGQPVIRNTRVPTSTIVDMYHEGVSIGELEILYEPIPKETIEKAIDFEEDLDQALAAPAT